MPKLRVCLVIMYSTVLGLIAPVLASEPAGSLWRFSSFPEIDLKRLLEGDIISRRGPLMNFPNGISSQICYAVPTSPEETARRLQTFDSTRCPPLKIYVTHIMTKPCKLDDFRKLFLDPGKHPIRWLLGKTLATTSDKSDLNLTRLEARQLADCVRKDSSPGAVSSCWARVLFFRTTAFQSKGLNGILPYETGDVSINPVSMIRQMLQEDGRIVQEFHPILKKTGILDNRAGATPDATTYNWNLYEADHQGTISLGATFQLAIKDRYQVLDIDYYVSSKYYTSATLYEIWPIRVGNRTGSLVWRGDFFAAPVLQFTKGIERIAYGAVMIQEIKKGIRCFQESLAAHQ